MSGEASRKSTVRVGVVQLCSTDDPWENLLKVNDWVRLAQQQKCDCVFFPENVLFRGNRKTLNLADREFFDADRPSELQRTLMEFATDWTPTVFLGSLLENSGDQVRPYNASWVLREGRLLCSYRKIHLFDFNNGAYQESAQVTPGSEAKVVTLDSNWRIGLSICFDLRFPELYRNLAILQQANIVAIPAAFTSETGKHHWEALVRARAIENLCYVVAPGQWGEHVDGAGITRSCYGHSLIVDPWGQVLVRGGAVGDDLLVVDCQKTHLDGLRKQLPALGAIKLMGVKTSPLPNP